MSLDRFEGGERRGGGERGEEGEILKREMS